MKNILKDKLTFKQDVTISTEKIEDMLDTAFNRACFVWLHIAKEDIDKISPSFMNEINPRKLVMMGALLPIRDIENQNEFFGKLNVFMIINALQAMANGEDLAGHKNDMLKKHFNDFITDNEDEITTDVIMQIAVMGEVSFD